MKKWIFLAGTLTVALVTFWWLFTHSFITINSDNSQTETSYTLTNVISHKSTQFKSKTSIKKIVRKGQYEVLATQNHTSYLAIVHAGRFLGTSDVTIKLAPEKSRTFIGDSPAACMYYIAQVLASVDCGDLYSRLQAHVPATAKQPTITSKSSGLVDGIIEGIASTSQGTVALLRTPSGNSHKGYLVHPDLSLTDAKAMTDLDGNKLYTMQPYKEGFIVYDGSFSQMFYYSSLSAHPTTITIKQATNKKMVPYALRVQDDSILVAYSDNKDDYNKSEDHTATTSTSKASVSVVIYRDNKTAEYKFKHRVSSFAMCGTAKLCLLASDGQLEVYDVTTNNPRYVFTIDRVERIEPSKSGFIVATKDGLVGMDVEKQQGYMEYSYDAAYSLCGMAVDSQGPTLCLANSVGKTVALRINPGANNTDSIDKKVAQLITLPEIKSLSIYDKFIYISPELGTVQYQPSIKSFGYDPVVIQTVNSRIKQAINAYGIDLKTYTVLNAFEN